MSRCLVTGHKGYIGSKVYASLQEQGHEVIGIDLQQDVPKDILVCLKQDADGGFHPYYSNFKPEYIFHLACIPRVVYSVEKPVETMINNVLATTYVLNFARHMGTKRVIYSDSSSVVGNGDGPNSPYGLQKLVSEWECKLYSELYGLDTVSLRYFNVYSPCQKTGGAYGTAIANWMQYIRDVKDPYITGDGEQRRDMVHVQDVVSANLFAMNYEENFNGRHYDVGTGQNISLNEIKDIILNSFPNIKFEYALPREGDVLYTKAETSDLSNIGWEASWDIKSGISQCFELLKEELSL
jgi:UDP-glucose 4-epimerase